MLKHNASAFKNFKYSTIIKTFTLILNFLYSETLSYNLQWTFKYLYTFNMHW